MFHVKLKVDLVRGASMRAAVLLACLAALGVAAWLWQPSALTASGNLPSLTLASPIGNPQLSLGKRVDNASPAPGTQINYTLSYSNANPGGQAFNVRLYDFLPAGVQFVSSNPSATPDANGVLQFTASSVGPGTENHDVTVQVRVLEGYSQIVNHALIAADFVTPTFASLATAVAQPSPGQLRLTKLGDPFVLANGQVVYTVRCENTGGSTLSGVTLVDVMPASLALAAVLPAPGTSAWPVLTWSLGDLEPGESRSVTITATAPSAAGVITNTAIADARQQSMTTTLYSTQMVTQGAILRVSKSASAAQVRVGDTLVYTLRYSNAGNQAAAGVALTDTLPAGINVTAASPMPATGLGSSQLVWQLGSLGVGAEGRVVFTATVGGPVNRTLHNVADIAGPAGCYPHHAELDTTIPPLRLYLPLVRR